MRTWIMRKAIQARDEYEYKCIACGEVIPIGTRYIRWRFRNLEEPLCKPYATTYGQRRPYFHTNCFKKLRGLFESTVPVYELANGDWHQVKL